MSKWKTGHVSPMLWLSAGLVVVFGALTLYFRDDMFIKMKPTIVYAMFSAILTFGLVTGRPLIQMVLGSVYSGLTPEGWRKLTRNWALFFAFMAVLNEAVWRNSTWDFWVGFKLWGAMPLTIGFAIANIPMPSPSPTSVTIAAVIISRTITAASPRVARISRAAGRSIRA